jgi:hypothetical protein
MNLQAKRKPMLDKAAGGSAGLHLIVGEAVDLQVAPVAHHHAALLVEQISPCDMLFRAASRWMFCSLSWCSCSCMSAFCCEAGIEDLLFGHVLVRGNPPAARNWMMAKSDHAAIGGVCEWMAGLPENAVSKRSRM